MRVRWKYPDLEDDDSIHLTSNDIERTLCGLAFEGVVSVFEDRRAREQTFVTTNKKANCEQCIGIWEHCQSIKRTEIEEKTNA